METTNLESATIIFEGSETTVSCKDIGHSAEFVVLYNEQDVPFKMFNNRLVVSIELTYGIQKTTNLHEITH